MVSRSLIDRSGSSSSPLTGRRRATRTVRIHLRAASRGEHVAVRMVVHLHETGKHDPNGGQQPHTSRLRLARLDDPWPLDREEEGSTPSLTDDADHPSGSAEPSHGLRNGPTATSSTAVGIRPPSRPGALRPRPQPPQPPSSSSCQFGLCRSDAPHRGLSNQPTTCTSRCRCTAQGLVKGIGQRRLRRPCRATLGALGERHQQSNHLDDQLAACRPRGRSGACGSREDLRGR